jgi:hypothetical protein
MHPDVSFGYECPFVAARDRIPRRLGPLDCAPVGHVGTVRECVSERALARGAAEASGELGRPQVWSYERRTGSPARAREGEPKAPRGARDPKKSRALLRGRDRAEVGVLHRFVRCGEGQPPRLGSLPRARGLALGLLCVRAALACQRAREDGRISQLIHELHDASGGTMAHRACAEHFADAAFRSRKSASPGSCPPKRGMSRADARLDGPHRPDGESPRPRRF